MEKEKIMKIVQEMMVKCNNKPEVFQKGRQLPDISFPRVTVINVK